MAHVGKFWKLHFRRDLSAQAPNNRTGWAEQYRITFARLGGSIGQFVRDTVPLLPISFVASNGQMNGTTANFIANGHTVHATVQMDLAGTPQVYHGSMSIIDSVRGKVYQEEWSTLVPGFYGFIGRGTADSTLMETPMVCFTDFSADLFWSEAQSVQWP